MGTGSQPSWWNQLDELDLPICLIVGAEDEKFVRLNEQMDMRCHNSVYHLVPEAGHAVHLEQPELFSDIVEQFIKQY